MTLYIARMAMQSLRLGNFVPLATTTIIIIKHKVERLGIHYVQRRQRDKTLLILPTPELGNNLCL